MPWYDQARAKNPEFLPEQNWATNFKAGIKNVRSVARQQVDTERLQYEQWESEQAKAFGRMMADYRIRKAKSSREFQIAQQTMQQQERQREWDRAAEEGQMWGKLQEQARAALAKDPTFLSLSPADMQRKIAEQTYKLATTQYATQGDIPNAKEAQRLANIAAGLEAPTEQDYAKGTVARATPTETAAPQEAQWKDLIDSWKVAFVSSAKQLVQSPLTVAGTYAVGPQSSQQAGIAAGYYAQYGKKEGETTKEYQARRSSISPANQAIVDRLGVYGEKIQAEYDTWYTTHPELWPRPEWEPLPSEVWKTDKKTYFNPLYWGSKGGESFFYMAGAMVAGGLGYVATGGNPLGAAMGAYAFTYPMMTQMSYETGIHEGLDRNSSLELASVIGPATAVLEVATDVMLVWSAVGVKKLFMKKVTEGLTKNAVKNLVKKNLVRAGLRNALMVGGMEIFTEGSQDVVTNAGIKTFKENKKLFEGMGDTVVLTVANMLPFMFVAGLGGAGHARQTNLAVDYQVKLNAIVEEELAEARKADEAIAKGVSENEAKAMREYLAQRAADRVKAAQVEANKVIAAAAGAEQLRQGSMERQAAEGRTAEVGILGEAAEAQVAKGYQAELAARKPTSTPASAPVQRTPVAPQQVAQAAAQPPTEYARSVSAQPVQATAQVPEASMGNETAAYDPDGREYALRFAVVDLDQLVTSHLDSFQQNPNYPKELQPRDRTRAANVQQVNQIVAKFHPEQLLVDSRDLGSGTPVVGGDLIVESGNGRVLALRKIQRSNPEAFAQYQAQLRSSLAGVGIAPEAVEGMTAPVLVRVSNIASDQRAQFASVANARTTMGMSPFEQALEDAKRISAGGIAKLAISENESIEQALRKAANQHLAQELSSNLSTTETASITAQDGTINAVGIERLKWAIFAKTYIGEAGERLVRTFSESVDTVVKNIQTAMFQSLPQMAQAEALVHSGQLDQGLSIAPVMADVVEVFAGLKQSGMAVNDYLKQASMFEEQLTPLEKRILEHMDALGQRSPKPFREFLRTIAARIQNAPQVGQGTLVETGPVTLEEIVNDAITKAQSATDSTADFGRRPGLFETVQGVGEGARGGLEEARGAGPEAEGWQGQGKLIGGGVSYDAVGSMFSLPTHQGVTKQLYENVAEQRRMALLRKLPGGQAVSQLISKVSKRQEQVVQAAVELQAEALHITKRIANGRAVALSSLARSYFPNGDIVSHWGIGEDRKVTTLQPKSEFAVVERVAGRQLTDNEVSMHVYDVLQYPERFVMDEASMKFMLLWKQVRSMSLALLTSEGIELDEDWMVENYFPRMVQEVKGVAIKHPHVDILQPREYSTALEALDNEVVYARDPIETMDSYIREVFSVVAAHRLSEGVKAMSTTPSARVPASIRYGREIAIQDWQRAVRAEQTVQRARRGETIPPATLASIRRLSPMLSQGIVDYMAMPIKERRPAGAALLLQARDLKATKLALDNAARAEYHKALKIAKQAKPWEGEATWQGRILENEGEKVKAVLASFQNKEVGKWLETGAAINDTLRTMVASTDWSSLAIQNILLLGRPLMFARVAAKSIDVFVHKAAQYTYFAQAEVVAYLQRHPDTKVGIQHEYAAGVSAIARIPKVGKYLAAPLRPFERFFGFSGDMARIEMGRVLEPIFVKAGMPDQVGTFVNRMTGVMNSEALGISAKQRAVERLMFFAPQYTRAGLAFINYVGQNNVMGKQAIKEFGRFAAVGTMMYVATALALGQEPQLDPTKPTFYTVKVGNRRVGIGGFQYSFLRFIADCVQSIASTDGNEPLDFTKLLDRKRNPITKWLYSRSAPVLSMGVEALTQRDYLGYPLDDLESWSHWLIIEHMFPIGLQEQIPSRTQEAPTNRLAIAAAEWVGMRTYEDEPFYELANEYAEKDYGKEWGDLWKPTKSGTYVKSPEQKALLAKYPDLKAAYDKWSPMQSKRWQADHGLLPDEDAINDYYARQVFNRPWDRLTRSEKNQVKQYREFAEQTEENTPSGGVPKLAGSKLPGLG